MKTWSLVAPAREGLDFGDARGRGEESRLVTPVAVVGREYRAALLVWAGREHACFSPGQQTIARRVQRPRGHAQRGLYHDGRPARRPVCDPIRAALVRLHGV